MFSLTMTSLSPYLYAQFFIINIHFIMYIIILSIFLHVCFIMSSKTPPGLLRRKICFPHIGRNPIPPNYTNKQMKPYKFSQLRDNLFCIFFLGILSI